MVDNSLVEALYNVDKSNKISDLPELEDGQTVDELAVAANKSDDWIRTRLKAKASTGQLIIGRKQIVNLRGQLVWTVVYKLRPEESNGQQG